MSDCLFCKIVSGDIPAKITYRDDNVVIFDDINPQAPIHKIIIPHKHIATLNDLQGDDSTLIGQMVQAAATLAKQLNMANDGYRLVMNCNANGGQSVYHLHLHLLGDRRMSWPPG